jgi:hypothetical protein
MVMAGDTKERAFRQLAFAARPFNRISRFDRFLALRPLADRERLTTFKVSDLALDLSGPVARTATKRSLTGAAY